MEVTSVGDRTEYGKVYEGSQIDNKVQTPLNRQLSRLGDLITWASYAIAALIIIGRLTLYFSHLPGQMCIRDRQSSSRAPPPARPMRSRRPPAIPFPTTS